MTLKVETRDRHLAIAGEMNIYHAAQIKSAVLAHLDSIDAIELSEVTELDTSGVQILLLAQRESRLRNRGLGLVAPSESVRSVFDVFGLSACFDDSPALSASQA